MKVLFLSVLLIGSSLAITTDQSVFAQMEETFTALSESQTGKFILELAQIHSELQGPIEDLIDSIAALEEELYEELKRLEASFLEKQNSHANGSLDLQDKINQAQLDVVSSRDNIDNFLAPQIAQLEQRITQLKQNIKDNRDTLARETLQRDQGATASRDKVKDYGEILAAIDEALQLISQLVNQSFIETKASVDEAIQKLSKKIQDKAFHFPLVKALLELTQNFSDQGGVKEVIRMLNELRNDIVNQLNTENKEERDRVDAWKVREQNLNSELYEFKNQLNFAVFSIEGNQKRIEEEQSFRDTRQTDLDLFKEQLESEEDSFNSEQQTFNDQKASILRSIAVAQKAYEFITSAQFSDYVVSRINQTLVRVQH